MEKEKIKIGIVNPNPFLNEDGTYNKKKAILLGGKIAGECYDKEGFDHINQEPVEKTMRRVDLTLNNGHHSVYGHEVIKFNLQNVPKALAMMINNEKEYTTAEKSARYTPVEKKEGSIITAKEEELYNKWMQIFQIKIKEKYGDIYNASKIKKLAQENARYLVTVFMPTQLIYTTSFRQINYIASWMEKFQKEVKEKGINATYFEKALASSMKDFVTCLDDINILEDGLLQNEKDRSFSLIAKDDRVKDEFFGDVYSTNYKGSFAELAQLQRHRTINYEMKLPDEKNPEFFVPPILEDDAMLVDEWLNDISSVADINPQGQLVSINERGTYEDFILKCKERLCSAAQLEIMRQTKDTLNDYRTELIRKNHPLAHDITKYTKGARCTFCDFKCTQDCKFKEGKTLVRKI